MKPQVDAEKPKSKLNQKTKTMKTSINLIKWLIFSLVAVLLLASDCNKEEEITGDSFLKVINDCNITVTIYFDGTKLGKINSDEDETWSVPSGSHTVKATSSLYQDYEASHNFQTGKTTIIRLEVIKKKNISVVGSD